MTTKVKITKTRGDTSRISCTIKDSTGKIVPINNWTDFTCTVDPNFAPDDDAGNVSQMTGSLVTDGLDGRFYFNADPAIPVGNYFFDVQAIDGNGDKTTIMKGSYVVTQDITKT